MKKILLAFSVVALLLVSCNKADEDMDVDGIAIYYFKYINNTDQDLWVQTFKSGYDLNSNKNSFHILKKGESAILCSGGQFGCAGEPFQPAGPCDSVLIGRFFDKENNVYKYKVAREWLKDSWGNHVDALYDRKNYIYNDSGNFIWYPVFSITNDYFNAGQSDEDFLSDTPFEGSVPVYWYEHTEYVDCKVVCQLKYFAYRQMEDQETITSWQWDAWGLKKLHKRDWVEVKFCGLAGFVGSRTSAPQKPENAK